MFDPDTPRPAPELLAKVHPPGGPLLGAPVTCQACGRRFERGTPTRCPEQRTDCPHTGA